MRRVVIMGAGGRDFHVFNTVFRDDPGTRVVAFTAAQIPGIDDRTYPASLAGPLYPDGIRIVPEEALVGLVHDHDVHEVVFAYSDLAHVEVMHKASIALAAGADVRMAGPHATMLPSTKPVVAIGAVRTGCGKSQTTRAVGRILLDAGLRVALIRHPMPYGDLEAMRVQRFASLADIDAADPTLEEREEYEAPVAMGMVMFAGVDYADILRAAEAEADVIVWDGGNNDFPFVRPDLMITVVDPLRPGHESTYHPGETTLRLADVVVVNKVDSAHPGDVEAVVTAVRSMVPAATIVRAESPVTLDGPPGSDGPETSDAPGTSDGPGSLAGLRVLVIEDGPTLTHGGMPFGAGTVAARAAGAAEIVDPRPYAVGRIAETFRIYPDTGPVLPAMGYSTEQLADLAATCQATPVDVVVSGTPMDLGRLIDPGHPMRRASYALREVGAPTLVDVLEPYLAGWAGAAAAAPAD